jgi:hypothetical protein
VRPGLTVHLAKYDRMAAIGDVGCYHVLRADGFTLCGRNTHRPNWRDAGWGDSEVICCKLCARILWPRWLRDGACAGVDPNAPHTLTEDDNWPVRAPSPGPAPRVSGGRGPIAALPATPRGPTADTTPAPVPAVERCDG